MNDFNEVRACLNALHGPAYIGQDEARDKGLSAVANIETEVKRLREEAGWIASDLCTTLDGAKAAARAALKDE